MFLGHPELFLQQLVAKGMATEVGLGTTTQDLHSSARNN